MSFLTDWEIVRFPILSRAVCPKCRARGAERKGTKEGVSVWECVSCAYKFEVKILKLQKSG